MTPEVKKRIEQIRQGIVPEGYKKGKIGIVPIKWNKVPFSTLFTSTSEYTDDLKQYPLYSLTIEDGITAKTERYERSHLVKKENSYKVVRPNDYAYNPMNIRFGAVARHKGDIPVAVSGYYDIFTTVHESDLVFMDSFLTYGPMITYYNKVSTGSLVEKQRVHFSDFLEFSLALPPLEERKKIAEILSTQDKTIELQGRKIEELKRFKKGCLEKMFPRKGQKVPEKRFPRFTDDWEQRKLGEVFNFHYGDGNNNPSNGGQYPVFGAGGIQGRYTKYNAENSIIIGHMGDAGCVSWGEGKHFVTYNGTITTPKDDVFTAKFGYYLLLNMNLRKYRGGSGLPFLTYDMLTEMETKCPNSKIETQEIADYFTQLDKLITLHQRKLEEMKKQKKALMQLLLTGIVRI